MLDKAEYPWAGSGLFSKCHVYVTVHRDLLGFLGRFLSSLGSPETSFLIDEASAWGLPKCRERRVIEIWKNAHTRSHSYAHTKEDGARWNSGELRKRCPVVPALQSVRSVWRLIQK